MKNQVRAALEGNVAAIARLITQVETTGDKARDVQKEIFQHTGKAHLVGITGPAGSGKSTLISKLAAKLAADGQKVAIVACDPSSPKTGGALLGDRIRMHELVHDKNIFNRKQPGGVLWVPPTGIMIKTIRITDKCGTQI